MSRTTHGHSRHSQAVRQERERSRSPRGDHQFSREVKRHRERSPHRHEHHHKDQPGVQLPFASSHLHKHDLSIYGALFAEYLDLQKQIDISQLDRDEVKGRWKSFLGKWNRGELAEGWYDPETKRKADERYEGHHDQQSTQSAGRPVLGHSGSKNAVSEDEEDGFGPALPEGSTGGMKGATAPTFEDLQQRSELASEEREAQMANLRYERKQNRQSQKERLDELVPRAQAGSRERQLEKKRDAAASNRTFAEAKDAGTEEVGDKDLMGGDDGVDGYKAKKRAMEKQKNEREIRKEEVLRARAVEREERMANHRKKEDKTMEMLKALARQRFGGEAV